MAGKGSPNVLPGKARAPSAGELRFVRKQGVAGCRPAAAPCSRGQLCTAAGKLIADASAWRRGEAWPWHTAQQVWPGPPTAWPIPLPISHRSCAQLRILTAAWQRGSSAATAGSTRPLLLRLPLPLSPSLLGLASSFELSMLIHSLGGHQEAAGPADGGSSRGRGVQGESHRDLARLEDAHHLGHQLRCNRRNQGGEGFSCSCTK